MKKKRRSTGKRSRKSNVRSKNKRKLWKKILTVFIFLGALGVFLIFGFFLYIVASTGKFDPNALANQDQTIIYDNEDNVIAKLGNEKRESVSYDELPQVLIDAIVATEDSRFFQHNGVDGARFFKASIGQLFGNSSAGGASTLTMQVVKNNLTSTDQTIVRKFKDVYLSVFFMEKKYSKQEIMEFYVNDSLLGGNVYGVEEASKYYFNKSVSELSLPEAALMAGLFQSPNGYNPYNKPEQAQKRMKTVLKLMVRHGYITQEEADIANSIDVSSLLSGVSEENSYQGYVDTVVEEVEKKTGNSPYLVSMEIHTAMVPDIQDGINKVMNGNGYTWKDDKVQAGITIVDVNSGAISAIGAGRNRQGELTYNYATMAKRQPGSTAKPIFAYGPGFEYDNFSTYQLFNDEAWSYSDGTEFGNWDSGYKGLMTLREALSVSRNVPAIKALQTVNKDVGNSKIVQFVENLGIDLDKDVAYESYAIGGLDEGVTTVQMAGAYAAFANGGYYIEPYTVKSITYRSSGKTKKFESKKTRAMKDSTAYMITNVLEYAAHYGFSGGTGSYSGTVAAKTGTSNYNEKTLTKYGLPKSAVNDLWTVAYTPQYSISLWYGYDEVSSQYYNTSSSPKDNLMSAIMKCIPVNNESFKQPSSVVSSQVEYGTWPAQKPSEYTPSNLIRTEYFASGSEPTETSARFAKLSDVKNLKATETSSGVKLTWSADSPEVLSDTYLKKLFSQSVFGNGTNTFIEERKSYNSGTLGGYGFGIYVNGSEVAFTTDKSYTYKAKKSGNVEIVVKAEYKNFKANASNGVSVKATATGSGGSDELNISITSSNSKYTLGNYSESGITVTYEDEDVTNGANIKYSVEIDGATKTYTSESDLESAINEITTPGTYTITYKVSYDGNTGTKTKTITLE
jgi:penicillin-binding protein 1A